MSPSGPYPPRGARSRWAEWLTVLVLLAMAGVLGWLNVSLAKRVKTPDFPPFDLWNAMLDARAKECVEVFGQDRPHDATCLRVLEDGLVKRPTEGPASLAGHRDLNRAPPYLACRLMPVAPGQDGCASGGVGESDRADQVLLYALDDFGVPRASHRLRPDSIEALWVESGGSERLVYLVVLQDYSGGTFKCFVNPDREATVAGLLRVELLGEKPGSRPQVFSYRDLGECP